MPGWFSTGSLDQPSTPGPSRKDFVVFHIQNFSRRSQASQHSGNHRAGGHDNSTDHTTLSPSGSEAEQVGSRGREPGRALGRAVSHWAGEQDSPARGGRGVRGPPELNGSPSAHWAVRFGGGSLRRGTTRPAHVWTSVLLSALQPECGSRWEDSRHRLKARGSVGGALGVHLDRAREPPASAS